MGFQINTNVSAMNAYRNLSMTQNDMSKSLEKLSSGLRINRAADDAAGLALAEGLKSQVGGLTVASRNAQDGIGVVQTAEGALTEVHSILQRMRDLAVQAGNDSNNAESRGAIATEVEGLTAELGRIAENTNFNGNKLLNGSTQTMSFQVGAGGDESSQISVNLSGANVKAVADTLGAVGGGGTRFDIAAFDGTTGAPTDLAEAEYSFSSVKDGVTTTVAVTPDGGTDNAFTSVEEFAAALNADSDFASNFTASVVKNENGTGTGILVKANDGGDVDVTDPAGGGLGAGTAIATGAAGLDFSTAEGARAAIGAIDAQIKDISSARSELGAVQNRFESTIKNVNVSIENLSAAESRIRDTDMAKEMADYTRSSILSQAGTAMLAQANQMNQGVLQLLG
ncbi:MULTISPECIES: flagellin [unclassified Arthrobacter]|uniref:flagellin N-terminal helical domain-containing protein n=1 Tax=unclassified Arthrobacter TaxID=235627 RepID=UPI0014930758|nr:MULTISPECIES: flagellin [unclassified Arthrobacter]MBE0010796.1 flagellin [Arthrobacter sp. AET 35A]NOJ60500.1 flagellin [Arthrobacter sp. 260]NOJ64637.1 flagellin [Arthrobacter sp. 147(2020)]